MDYIKVGTITGTRGLKGEVKVKSSTNMQTSRFMIGNTLYIHDSEKLIPLEIHTYRSINKVDVLSFKKYLDINKAEKLVGCELFMSSDYEVKLSENEFFVDELIGMKVFQNKKIKGVVKDIVTYPQGDYLLIETENGEKFVPFRDEFIEYQDDERIDIIDLEGLL
jgi:16S rRNA processing protein RimM